MTFLTLLCVLPSCNVIKEELGINGNDDSQKNVKKTPCTYFTFDGHYTDERGNENYAFRNPEPTFSEGPKSGTKALSFSRANKSNLIVNDGFIDSSSMTVSFWAQNIDEGLIFGVLSTNVTLGSNEMMLLTYESGHLRYVMNRFYSGYANCYDLGFFRIRQ